MFEQLVEMVEGFAQIDVKATSGFRARVLLKEKLTDGLGTYLGQYLAAEVSLELLSDLTDEQIERLIDPYARMVIKVVNAFQEAGFNDDNVLALAKDFSLKLTG